MTLRGVSASLTFMTDEPTVAELQQRITELEEQVAELKGQLQGASGHSHADPGEDKEWGEFNPG